jgi:hypothetical protein
LQLLVTCGFHHFHLCNFIVVIFAASSLSKALSEFHYLCLLLHYFVEDFDASGHSNLIFLKFEEIPPLPHFESILPMLHIEFVPPLPHSKSIVVGNNVDDPNVLFLLILLVMFY